MSYNTRSSRVRMDTLNTLTFYNGEMTAARRSSPVPQLECVGKPCKLYQPDVVQCTAVGRNGPDVEWSEDMNLRILPRLWMKIESSFADVSCHTTFCNRMSS